MINFGQDYRQSNNRSVSKVPHWRLCLSNCGCACDIIRISFTCSALEVNTLKTQIGIIGGGPSGLLLSQLLQMSGIETVVLERCSKAHVLARIRAGVLECGTVNLLEKAGASANLKQYSDTHSSVDIVFQGETCKVNFSELLNGAKVTVYGQTELTKDLYQVRNKAGGVIVHHADEVAVHAVDSDTPFITYTLNNTPCRLDCEFIVGCDGFHGPSRQAIPDSIKTEYERSYPFGWLGVLSDTPPVSPHCVIYTYHQRGFALCSMRSATRSRYYIQVPINADLNTWSDDRFWQELKRRLPKDVSEHLITGPSIEKSITPLRSFICEPMQWNKLFLAGDAAHIVPPTGAKGLNLAASDVYYLHHAFIKYYADGDDFGLMHYSDQALKRVWKSSRFSWSLTRLLHDFYEDDAFINKMRLAEFNYLKSSPIAQTSFAENYVGLPY